jgi:UDP-glucose 4-epimerase
MNQSEVILVTGGAGYIGSHTVVELLQAGLNVVVVDNFSNSNPEAINRVERITGRTVPVCRASLLDCAGLEAIFERYPVQAVIHFAGLKAVGESVAEPQRYYRENIVGTLNLCEAMTRHGVKKIVFSSSACVYGDPASVPIQENFPTRPTNPYGWSKLMIEQILTDLQYADPAMNVALLRYFNPVGAHPSGLIGEDPRGIPNNLMPFIAQVAVGRRVRLSVFGNDYPTPDGTGVRDYIHVVDLAQGHLNALSKLNDKPGRLLCNLGTGRGYSVLEMVAAFKKAAGREIPYEIMSRRPGDIAECYADPALARELLGWQAKLGINEMCRDHWNWQEKNPRGYEVDHLTG